MEQADARALPRSGTRTRSGAPAAGPLPVARVVLRGRGGLAARCVDGECAAADGVQMRTGLGPGSMARIWHVGCSGERGRAVRVLNCENS